jgi:3-hydroxybutyryl-CoA dehydratase
MSEGEILSFFLEDLTVGQSASYGRAISEADVREFALMSGDFNPVHLDEAYAQNTRFKGRIVHGMLPVTFVSTVLGTRLPGAGAIFMGATFRFKAPVRIGDTVVATCTVREINTVKSRVTFDCICKVGDTVVVEGDALVMVPSKEAQEKAPADKA